MVHSGGKQISSRIREIMCDSNHFTSTELSRWSMWYSEINTLVNLSLVESSQLWGGVVGEKTTFGRALFRADHCVDGLKGMINLLIGATFVLNTMSSVYFQHIFLSLNLPSTPRMSLTLSVLWSNGIMRDWTTYGPCWSPSLSGDVIPTPHPSALPYYQMASMCSTHYATYQHNLWPITS